MGWAESSPGFWRRRLIYARTSLRFGCLRPLHTCRINASGVVILLAQAPGEGRASVKERLVIWASGNLMAVTVPDGELAGGKAALPALPVAIGGNRPSLLRDAPSAGRHSEEILAELADT